MRPSPIYYIWSLIMPTLDMYIVGYFWKITSIVWCTPQYLPCGSQCTDRTITSMKQFHNFTWILTYILIKEDLKLVKAGRCFKTCYDVKSEKSLQLKPVIFFQSKDISSTRPKTNSLWNILFYQSATNPQHKKTDGWKKTCTVRGLLKWEYEQPSCCNFHFCET